MPAEWLIGVALSFGGCCLSNFGVNLQKKSHLMIQASGKQGSYVSHPVWILGITCVIVGSLADLFSFGFADMSLLAPLGAMTLVVNMLIAPCFLKEKLTTRDVVFTIIIVLGTVLSILFGSKESKSYTLTELLEMYIRPFFLTCTIIAVVVLIILFAILKYINVRIAHGTATEMEVKASACMYPALGGTFGSFSVLFAKSAAEIFKTSFSGEDNGFKNPLAYVIFLSLFAALFVQMKLLNSGLDRADALLVVPIYQVFWVIMNVTLSMVYFQDYKNVSYLDLYFFALGVAITLLGVYFLANRSTEQITVKDEALLEEQDLETPGITPETPGLTPEGTPGHRRSTSATARRRTHTFHFGFHHSLAVETPNLQPARTDSNIYAPEAPPMSLARSPANPLSNPLTAPLMADSGDETPIRTCSTQSRSSRHANHLDAVQEKQEKPKTEVVVGVAAPVSPPAPAADV